jgi:hypothetical protein
VNAVFPVSLWPGWQVGNGICSENSIEITGGDSVSGEYVALCRQVTAPSTTTNQQEKR